MSRLYEYIRGKDIVEINEEDREPIIEGMIYKGDYILFVAEEKVGKTILSQQLVCSLSSGESFLKTFDVNKPSKVWYMFNEVRMDELKERFINMSKAVPMDVDKITLIPFKFLFNTDTGEQQLKQIVAENQGNFPDVIILDSLYKAIDGSLKKDEVVNKFNDVFRTFASSLGGCARIVVHHLTKPGKDDKGNFYKRNDKDSYGSAFLLADIDHIFRLEKWGDDPNTKERALKCDTQRSGNIIETTRLRLIEPSPLYYEIMSVHVEEKAHLIKVLNKKKLDIKGVMKETKLSRATCYRILKELRNDNIVEKSGSKVKFYHIPQTIKNL